MLLTHYECTGNYKLVTFRHRPICDSLRPIVTIYVTAQALTIITIVAFRHCYAVMKSFLLCTLLKF